jgi:hypothetical protein
LNLAYHGARAQDQSFNITLERDFADGVAQIELVPQDITASASTFSPTASTPPPNASGKEATRVSSRL